MMEKAEASGYSKGFAEVKLAVMTALFEKTKGSPCLLPMPVVTLLRQALTVSSVTIKLVINYHGFPFELPGLLLFFGLRAPVLRLYVGCTTASRHRSALHSARPAPASYTGT